MNKSMVLFVGLFALILSGWSCVASESSQTLDATPDGTVAAATFAGGCFWCMEPPFDKIEGVTATTSGYMGGSGEDATYEQVSAGVTGHFEVVQVVYDPNKVSYEQLLDVFWANVDPLDGAGQFCDKGEQYRSAIFYHDQQQQAWAQKSVRVLQKSGRLSGKIATQVLPAEDFYPAEDYHQDYYQKNPIRYRFYRAGCGRDNRLETLWGHATDATS